MARFWKYSCPGSVMQHLGSLGGDLSFKRVFASDRKAFRFPVSNLSRQGEGNLLFLLFLNMNCVILLRVHEWMNTNPPLFLDVRTEHDGKTPCLSAAFQSNLDKAGQWDRQNHAHWPQDPSPEDQ